MAVYWRVTSPGAAALWVEAEAADDAVALFTSRHGQAAEGAEVARQRDGINPVVCFAEPTEPYLAKVGLINPPQPKLAEPEPINDDFLRRAAEFSVSHEHRGHLQAAIVIRMLVREVIRLRPELDSAQICAAMGTDARLQSAVWHQTRRQRQGTAVDAELGRVALAAAAAAAAQLALATDGLHQQEQELQEYDRLIQQIHAALGHGADADADDAAIVAAIKKLKQP